MRGIVRDRLSQCIRLKAMADVIGRNSGCSHLDVIGYTLDFGRRR